MQRIDKWEKEMLGIALVTSAGTWDLREGFSNMGFIIF
jgi:hypothetical protein